MLTEGGESEEGDECFYGKEDEYLSCSLLGCKKLLSLSKYSLPILENVLFLTNKENNKLQLAPGRKF